MKLTLVISQFGDKVHEILYDYTVDAYDVPLTEWTDVGDDALDLVNTWARETNDDTHVGSDVFEIVLMENGVVYTNTRMNHVVEYY